MDRGRRKAERETHVQLSAFEARERRIRSKERYQEIRRIAVISDIHGNLEALEAVAADIRAQDCQSIVCLGDTVGYGANPIECLEWVRDNADISILGKHDAAVLGLSPLKFFSTYSAEVILRTRAMLPQASKDYLASLPLLAHFKDATFVHGSLDTPELFNWVQTTYDAYLFLELMETSVAFYGQTHCPISFTRSSRISHSFSEKIRLKNYEKTLVNVGSVGQPRDDNPKASYGIYDYPKRRIKIHRVEYDIEACAQKILAADFPSVFAERLRYGR